MALSFAPFRATGWIAPDPARRSAWNGGEKSRSSPPTTGAGAARWLKCDPRNLLWPATYYETDEQHLEVPRQRPRPERGACARGSRARRALRRRRSRRAEAALRGAQAP